MTPLFNISILNLNDKMKKNVLSLIHHIVATILLLITLNKLQMCLKINLYII